MIGSKLDNRGKPFLMILTTPYEIKKKLPLESQQLAQIELQRREIKKILTKNDTRIALVIGPCSIHDHVATLEYAERLHTLAQEVSSTCYIVMRAYVEKPRTITGWKGFLYDPYLDGTHDMNQGILLSRKLLLDLSKIGIPLATEFLDPMTYHYLEDLISWGFIGARTCTSSIHRQLASSLNMPVGFKNSTSGNVDDAINGVVAARASHCFIDLNENCRLQAKQSTGNFFSHIVLRGSNTGPNFDKNSVRSAINKLMQAEVPPRVLIDCAHGNSNKNHERQAEVWSNIADQIIDGNENIMGMMIESFLEAGHQPLTSNRQAIKPSISITDPCLSWASTRELVLSLHQRLSKEDSFCSSDRL